MFKKLLEKLADKFIQNAYREGWGDGYDAGYNQHKKEMHSKNTGAFKKGNVPWNKGKKKGVKNGVK